MPHAAWPGSRPEKAEQRGGLFHPGHHLRFTGSPGSSRSPAKLVGLSLALREFTHLPCTTCSHGGPFVGRKIAAMGVLHGCDQPEQLQFLPDRGYDGSSVYVDPARDPTQTGCYIQVISERRLTLPFTP